MAPKRKNRIARNSRGGRNAVDGGNAVDGRNAVDGVNAGDVGAGGSGVIDSVSKDKENQKGEFSTEGAVSWSESGLKLEKDPQGRAADKERFLANNPTLQADLENFFRSLEVKSESKGEEKITESKGKEKIKSEDQEEESITEGIVIRPILVPRPSVEELELAIKQKEEELEEYTSLVEYQKAALRSVEFAAVKSRLELYHLRNDLDHELSLAGGDQSKADGAANDADNEANQAGTSTKPDVQHRRWSGSRRFGSRHNRS